MSKFKIKLSERLPDFDLPVTVTLHNGQEATVKFKVKHLKSTEVQELYEKGNTSDFEFITNLATGWDLEDDFNQDNARELVTLYPMFAVALTQAYMGALAGARVKN